MINTEALSKSLNEFAKKTKINDNQYEQLRGRRNTIIDLIKDYSKIKNLTIVENFNVGSYKIKTGVKRNGKNGWAFDIDYVIAYNSKFDYETFKNNLTSWLRDKVKEKYKNNVIVSNKKKVISIAYRDNDNDKTLFYLDIAIYLKKNDDLYHVKRDDNGNYTSIKGEPKVTYERQRSGLLELESKRNAIIVLKYLKEKNRINGSSSIFITDSIIELNSDLDTFTLIKKFIQDNKIKTSFKLKELPNSELIKDEEELQTSLIEMDEKFFSSNTTNEVYKAMNSWLDNSLPDLDKDLLDEDRNERYSGG